MGIVVIGTAFVDIKGFPDDLYIPNGRNAGRVEYVHGGVARNVVEDIANMELRPTYLGIVDDTPMGADVLKKLQNHKVNTEYVLTIPDGMGIWLAVFDNNGDVAGSISKRPNAYPLVGLLEEKGDEIFRNADSVVLQVDLHKDIVKKTFELAEKYQTKMYALVSNMSIALERRDFLQNKNPQCHGCFTASAASHNNYARSSMQASTSASASAIMPKVCASVLPKGSSLRPTTNRNP